MGVHVEVNKAQLVAHLAVLFTFQFLKLRRIITLAFQIPNRFFQVLAPAFFLVPPNVFEGVAKVEIHVHRKFDALVGVLPVVFRVDVVFHSASLLKVTDNVFY